MNTQQTFDEAIEMLRKLVTIPSFSKEEDAASDYLEETLKPVFHNQIARKGNNLVIDVQGEEEGPTLLLCSHIDTVQVVDGWTRDPFGAEEENGRLYGLGSNDAGASFVSLIAAVKCLLPLKRGRILLALVAEEETGPNGFRKIEPELPRYDAAIFGEPTNLKMSSSMRGGMNIMIKSRGIGGHASNPRECKNAIDQFAKDLAVLRSIDLKDASPWGGATMEPTIIQGGKSANQIPALVETKLDIRTTPEKNNDWILSYLKQTDLEFEVLSNTRHPMFNPPDSGIVKAFRAHYPDESECVFNGSCDMAFAKAPSIILGPGDLKVAHVADEYTELAPIKEAITVYKNVISTYLSDFGGS